jgi:DNA-binding CsgD family transcriptional regulator
MLEARGPMPGNVPPAKSLPKLTVKQRDVLALVADNRTSKEIAARLKISESAVNQRIEMIRQRLGGLPRGELARLYRLEYAPKDEEFEDSGETWQKIHLPQRGADSKGNFAESISLPQSFGSHPNGEQSGDGSQLSALFFHTEDTWLARNDRATGLIRLGAIAVIIALALGTAAVITQLVGPVS